MAARFINGTPNDAPKIVQLQDLNTEVETCKYLQVCQRTLYRLRTERKIPYARIAGGIRYRRQDIEKFIDNHMAQA